MNSKQAHFPPHFMGRGTREAGEGPPRHAAEWRSEVPLSSGASRRPFDPMLRIGPLPHWRGEESLSVAEPGQDKYRTMTRARRLRRSMTDAELILWSRLRRRQMLGQHFRRQHPVGPYIADFACVTLKLIVEVDGDTHGTEAQLAYDARRSRFMESRGWRVIRCYNVDVYRNLDGVLTQIGDAVREMCQRSTTDTPLCDAPFDPACGRATSPAPRGRKSRSR